MLVAQRHRGPDGQGSLAFAGGAAGMVRLALIDPSSRGQQPLWSADGRCAILFNGEIYGFQAERKRLQAAGYPFATETDTEVILALYLERGLGCFAQLRGMFAVAIFDFADGRQNPPTVHLARDPFGIKPLYVANATGAFAPGVAFSSELRPLVRAGLVEPTPDSRALQDFLTLGFVVQPRTILKSARMLEAGIVESWKPGAATPTRTRHYRLPAAAPVRESAAEAAERLRHVVDESVRLHAFADARVGAYLSGGVDSTAIVALMRRHVSDLQTFTLRFPDLPDADESLRATESARELGVQLHYVDVDTAEAARSFPQFCESLDQPSSDGFNSWLVARGAAGRVKGVLSGLGGDELFAGYPVAGRMLSLQRRGVLRAHGLLPSLAKQLSRRLRPSELRERLLSFAAGTGPLPMWTASRRLLPADVAADLLDLPVIDDEAAVAEVLANEHPDWRGESALGLACLLDLRLYMGCQLLRDADVTNMVHGLELRVPFVDREVVAFSRSCADPFKRVDKMGGTSYRDSGAKKVLIDAVAEFLPAGVQDGTKLGFVLPMDVWARTALAPVVREALHESLLAKSGIIDGSLLKELAVHHGQPFALRRLVALTTLELWWRSFSKVDAH